MEEWKNKNKNNGERRSAIKLMDEEKKEFLKFIILLFLF
jgi:hypothetical protein